MKQQKIFSLDPELLDELSKEKNQSKVVNDLLSDYFNSGAKSTKMEILNKIILEEKEISKSKQKLQLLKEKLEAIEKKENLLKKIFKDIPDELLDDFKSFPKMTEDVLRNRFKDIYSAKYKDMNWPSTLKAYNQYFNKDGKDTKK
jgi:hypothetical protein